jgi:hypothetical protein
LLRLPKVKNQNFALIISLFSLGTGFVLTACQTGESQIKKLNEHLNSVAVQLNESSKDVETNNDYDPDIPVDSTFKTIHLFVALCDNKYQGIVPVPKGIGNGQDPRTNLYWGCGYGVKTFFKKSPEWTLIRSEKKDSIILERLIFKHRSKNYFLVADAYDGRLIKQCTIAFLKSSSGNDYDTVQVLDKTIGVNSHASLLGYIGHDGLMDFTINQAFTNKSDRKRDVIILACYSKSYFSQHLLDAKINPIVWTSGLIAPEAYTMHGALSGYVLNETNAQIRERAAQAYHQYQKCGINGARNLLRTGWE